MNHGYDGEIIIWNTENTQAAKFESAAASLITNGPEGSSKDKAQVSSIAVTAGDVLVYVADQKGFVHVYDIKEYGLQGPELQFPKILELVEEKFLLSSSLDRTVCLWSRNGGVHSGTFGQHSPRDIFTPASWSHPRVPYEILTDPRSMPALPVLEQDVAAMHTEEEGQDSVVVEEPEKTPNSCSLEEPILEAEMKEDINRCSLAATGPEPAFRENL
ncbi:hypothetical protein VULLAG_LOCUS23856 [Vulpes lagopus]